MAKVVSSMKPADIARRNAHRDSANALRGSIIELDRHVTFWHKNEAYDGTESKPAGTVVLVLRDYYGDGDWLLCLVDGTTMHVNRGKLMVCKAHESVVE